MDPSRQNEVLRRSTFRVMALALCCGAAIWACLCAAFGLWWQTLIPAGYIACTLALLYFSKNGRRTESCMGVQIFLSILLPFIFQTTIGGWERSGFVMFWSFSAMGGALTYRSKRAMLLWLVIELFLMGTWLVFDPMVAVGDQRAVDALPRPSVLMAVNILGTTLILFGLTYNFVRLQGRVRKQNYEMKLALAETNAKLALRNSEIEQSLAYAQTIQQALLPDLGAAHDHLAGGMVLYKPKECVGGDLYWQGTSKGHHLIVVMDCTGHGVPGALLTMLVHNILNEVVIGRGITAPKEVIKEVVTRIPRILGQDMTACRDSVELAIVRIDAVTGDHRFAGFGLGLMQISDGTTHLHAAYNPLLAHTGSGALDDMEETSLSLDPPCKFYVFTDGFGHQFGGTYDRKFTRRRLHQEILGVSDSPWPEQQRHFEQCLNEWRGDNEQVDDILIVGFEPAAGLVSKAMSATG